ncbi:MAG: inositol monophosphatase [Candidatus Peribacteria bacterium]|nr:MAG: inositol monophosphatase [Candidatus Peribacteria bacterium]
MMEQYLAFGKSLAQEAQDIALQYFGFDTEHTWKGDNTPLTIADTKINDLVIARVNEVFPTHSIYGEEQSVLKDDSRYIWVCDPIDGTMPFSNGLPIFTFSLALVDQTTGLPIFGLVNDPILKHMYWATKGGGAYRDGKQIFVSPSTDLTNTYVIAEGSGKAVGFSNLPLMQTLSEKKCKVMRFLSFIYGGIQVANGKFAGGVFYNPYGHDVAALKIITEEAGGKVTDLEGKERRYDQDGLGCLVSNGLLHDDLLEIIHS